VFNSIKRAIILAGGRGSRLGGLTSFGPGMRFGNMPKATLPVVGKPNITRIIEQVNKQCGINDFHVSSHYMAGDIISVLERTDFESPDIKIRHCIRDKFENTGRAIKDIIFKEPAYRYLDDYFMVIPGDVSFSNANINDFLVKFNKAASLNLNIVAGMAFVIRPASEMIRQFPSAVINENGVVERIVEPLHSMADVEAMFKNNGFVHPAMQAFWSQTGEMGIPLSTAIWIFNKNVFSEIPEPESRYEHDIGKYILPKLGGRMWGHIFPEAVEGRELLRSFYDLNSPEYFYRAQWSLIRTSHKLIPGIYNPALNSWMEDRVEIRGQVSNSVIANMVNIGRGSRVSHSVIGYGCKIEGDAEIANSVLLPFTYVNVGRSREKVKRISNSIVGGKIRGGTFLDARHIINFAPVINRAFAIPNLDGYVEISDLNINDGDIMFCKGAFKK